MTTAQTVTALRNLRADYTKQGRHEDVAFIDGGIDAITGKASNGEARGYKGFTLTAYVGGWCKAQGI